MSNAPERITVSLYPDKVLEDAILLELLNMKTTKRNRASFLKEYVLRYFRENYPDLIREITDRIREKGVNKDV